MAEYVIGTQTADTNKWTGKTSRTYLFENMTILYKLPTNSPSSSLSLNLTLFDGSKSGEIPVRSNYSSFNKDDEFVLTYSSVRSGTATWYTEDIYSVDDSVSILYCQTAGSSSSKVCNNTSVKVKSNSTYTVQFLNANTVKGALTLNINNTGAKPIYVNGTVSSVSNYDIPAGTYNVFYDGSSYKLRTGGSIAGIADEAIKLTATLPISRGGTGATSAATARNNLGLSGISSFSEYLVTSSNSFIYSIGNNYRGVMWFIDDTANGSGEYLLASSSAGKPVVTTVKSANGVTFNTSTNGKVIISLSSGSKNLLIMAF